MPMQYRFFPRVPGLAISALGFGSVRLPTLGGDPTRIDEAGLARLLHQAIEAGVNYVDTGWSYFGGQSERCLGRALRGGWRERVRLATQAPAGLLASEGAAEGQLSGQLERLGTDRVDFYLLEGLTREGLGLLERQGGLAALERARSQGRIGHLGFACSGSRHEFEGLVDARDWDLCQVPLNFLDSENQIGPEGLRHAAARKVGVVVAEPLRGGALARAAPVVEEAWSLSDRPWSPAEWALRWVWDRTEVVTALCGMRSEGHLSTNLGAAAAAGALSPPDLDRIEEVRRTYRTRRRVPCTSCGSCQLVCSKQIEVSNIFSLYNEAMFESKAAAAAEYRMAYLQLGHGADQCLDCGNCAPGCPKHIPVGERLAEAHAYLMSA